MNMDSHRTDRLRRAVASGEFQHASRLWDEYAAGIRQEICRGTCTEALMVEAREFLEWARRLVLCGHAQAQDQLNTIHVARQYGSAPSRPESFLKASL